MKTDFRPDKTTQPNERLRALRQLLSVTWRWLDIVRIERIQTARESGWKVTYVVGTGAAKSPDQEQPSEERDRDEEESRYDEEAESYEDDEDWEYERGDDAGAGPPSPRGGDDDDILGPPRRH